MATNGKHKLNARVHDWEREEITAAANSTGTTTADLVRDLLAYWAGVPGAQMPAPGVLGQCRRPAGGTCRWHPDAVDEDQAYHQWCEQHREMHGPCQDVPRCGEAGPAGREFCDEPVPNGYCPDHGEVGASA